MKRAVLLAGGSGTRLGVLTRANSKQLLGIYNKLMIHFPLQTLKELGYREILIICANLEQRNQYIKVLGNGLEYGLLLDYAIQGEPKGLADAFIVGEDFIKDADDVIMMLGDNVIIGQDWSKFQESSEAIFTYKVSDPSQYGVVIKNEDGHIDKLVEKPVEFISEDAVIGLYRVGNGKRATEIAKSLKPSQRGEIEIVDFIKKLNDVEYLQVHELNGFWFDCGDVDSLLDCANLVRTIDKRSNHAIGLEKAK